MRQGKNQFLILLLFAIFILTACVNPFNSDNEIDDCFTDYLGNWNWLLTQSADSSITVPDQNNSITISFRKNCTFRLYRNDSLKVTADFEIDNCTEYFDQICYSNIIMYNYCFSQDTIFTRIKSDTLIIRKSLTDKSFCLYIKAS